METINYVENPNYNKPESFEMRMIGGGGGGGNNGGDSIGAGGAAYSDALSNKRIANLQHPEYVVVIGGLETHKSAVFSKRDLVVWRLRVDCFCRGDEDDEDEAGFNYYYGGGGSNNHGDSGRSGGMLSNGNGGGGGGGFSRERSFEVEF